MSTTSITFVNPDGTPAEANNVSLYLDAHAVTWSGYGILFTAYDINGNHIFQQYYDYSLYGGICAFQFQFTPNVHQIVVTPYGFYTYIYDLSYQIPPTLSLSRLDLMTVNAVGAPAGGDFGWTSASYDGTVPAIVSLFYPSNIDPNYIGLTDPANPTKKDVPTPGALTTIDVTYSNGGDTANDNFSVPTFGMSCYKSALESDWGTPLIPHKCGHTKIYGKICKGKVTDPDGYSGTYCSAFICQTELQGSGKLDISKNDQLVQYDVNKNLIYNVSTITGSDISPVVAGQTVARDRTIIPTKNFTGLTIHKINNNNPVEANDTGGGILEYRLDLYNGIGISVCAGYTNPILVGACEPAQGTMCPSKAVQ